jgi:methionyl-tRNA formyltransferase
MATGAEHVFIGGRDRGLAWLRALARRKQLPRAVYCLREDDHETEKFAPEIVRFCQEHDVPCTPRRRLLREDEDEIVALAPDLLVVMGWRTLLSARVLSAPRFGTVGLHESLLPKYRGFAPVNWAVINGETQTGVSLFYITATGVDDGDIVAQARVPIGETDTAADVYQRTSEASLELLARHFSAVLAGTAPRTPQADHEATYTCARTPPDGLIDWGGDTRTIHNLVRGLAHPYPGASTFFSGAPLSIWRAEPVRTAPPYAGRIPGRVARVEKTEGWVEVLTGDGVLRVFEVQLPGEPRRPAADVLTSIKYTLGLNPLDLLQRLRAAESTLAALQNERARSRTP